MKALNELQNYTFVSKYARYLKNKKRRETWKEAVDRVKKMMLETYENFPEIHNDQNQENFEDFQKTYENCNNLCIFYYVFACTLQKHMEGSDQYIHYALLFHQYQFESQVHNLSLNVFE